MLKKKAGIIFKKTDNIKQIKTGNFDFKNIKIVKNKKSFFLVIKKKKRKLLLTKKEIEEIIKIYNINKSQLSVYKFLIQKNIIKIILVLEKKIINKNHLDN